MKKRLTLEKILKDKPEKTVLYDAMRDINVSLYVVEKRNGETNIFCDGMEKFKGCSFVYSDTGADSIFRKGMQILKPSKEMQDWEKFSWKRGDVLISDCGFVCIFKEWASDDYTKFNGCYSNSRDGYEDVSNAETAKFDKLDNNIAYGYVREIERKLGGILNLETLEIENNQPEFKDGDIIKMTWDKYSAIVIFWEYSNFGKGLDSHVFFNIKTKIIEYNIHGHTLQDMILRFATEEEKQQLFEALAKEGKHWDAEKKQIVDLKPKYEFKPMDLCLMKYIGKYNNRGWELCQYAYTEHRVSSSGEQRDFYHAVGGEIYAECIPYKGNEHLLGTKKSK